MREKVTTAAEIGGAVCIAVGIGLLWGFAFGLISAGVAAVVFGYLAGE